MEEQRDLALSSCSMPPEDRTLQNVSIPSFNYPVFTLSDAEQLRYVYHGYGVERSKHEEFKYTPITGGN
jgi:hypothetical protein